MLSGQLAIVASSMYAGSELYANVVELPSALSSLDDKSLLKHFKGLYSRCIVLDPVLAALGTGFGLHQWYLSHKDPMWLLGSGLALLNFPFTLFVLMPTNNKLMTTHLDTANGNTRNLVENWNRLHWGRVFLSIGSIGAFIYASMKAHRYPIP